MSTNTYTLERYLKAQELYYESALTELIKGRKSTHWSWFITPQLRGLGRSYRAHLYGLQGLHEAITYAEHPILGPRLDACFEAILTHPHVRIETIMGEVDALKLKSCATLFTHTALRARAQEILTVFYAGEGCTQSRDMLDGAR